MPEPVFIWLPEILIILLRPDKPSKPVRIGFVGVGSKGMSMLRAALSIEGVEVPVVCDIVEEKVALAQKLVEAAGQPRPKGFTGAKGYEKIADMNNLDSI